MTEGSSIRRVLTLAWREFRHTALTKGFIVGAVVVPGVMLAAFPLIPMLTKSKARPIEGRIVVIDRVGGVTDAFRTALLSKEKGGGDRGDPFDGPVEVRATVECMRMRITSPSSAASVGGLRIISPMPPRSL